MSKVFLKTWLLSIIVLAIVSIVGIVIYAMYLTDKDMRVSVNSRWNDKEIFLDIDAKNSEKKDEPVHETDSSNKSD